MFRQFLERIRCLAPPKNKPTPLHFSVDPIGITLSSRSGATRNILWKDISQIVALKRDVFAHDMICLLIQSTASITELDEFIPGWEDLTTAIPINLPGARALGEWFLEVAFPAFEARPTPVFKRIS